MRIRLLVLGLLLLAPAAAVAQGPYVSASLVADLARFSHASVSGAALEFPSGTESVGFALRLGTPIGSVWGVELEFNRSGEADTTFSEALDPAVTVPSLFTVDFNQQTRHSTFSTLIWARQDLGPRFALVYLGGTGFVRTATRSDIRYVLARPIPGLILPPNQVMETTVYSVRPVVGVEGRLSLTEHVELVPGLRLTSLQDGLIIRPSVGLGWRF